uniref:Large ribosomal subunit protein mL62 n=1 Tax=Podarcis muralis TaxID=64176 RepID=A0A670JC40_PODMU
MGKSLTQQCPIVLVLPVEATCQWWVRPEAKVNRAIYPFLCNFTLFSSSIYIHKTMTVSFQYFSLQSFPGRLSISYCRSSGPGGQNVNKVNTKAEVRFHLATADWISEDVRQKMATMYKNRISKSGELIVTSEVSRYQMRNLAACLQKIREMIIEATEMPRTESKETVEMIRSRVEKMNRERLRQKKIRSSVKQSRHVDFD